VKRLLLALAVLAGGGLAAVSAWSAARAGLQDVRALARAAPRRTALMRERAAEARRRGRPYHIRQVWVPYERISPLLRRAVLVAEDDAFYRHGGLDWDELAASARRDFEARRLVRGGSTITQQLAKNLYLARQRTLTRKLTEVFLAWRMERALSKRRIFELYLNLIEWGDGVFGAEAAARHSFGVSASDLSPRQALLLAAVIINPRRYSVLAPPRRIQRRVRMIASRMRRRGYLDELQYADAIEAPAPAAPASGTDSSAARAESLRAIPPPAGNALPREHTGRRRGFRAAVIAGDAARVGRDVARAGHDAARVGRDASARPPGPAAGSYAPSASFTRRETVAPSARPFTCAMTAPITLPVSFEPAAPIFATASRTTARSSSSESVGGR
jgi:monofunctional biosynthetic peptidoglycan transglycosylase